MNETLQFALYLWFVAVLAGLSTGRKEYGWSVFFTLMFMASVFFKIAGM